MSESETPLDPVSDPVLIDVPVPITTPRLILRPPQKGDGKTLHTAKLASLPALQKWMIWAKYMDTQADHTEDEIMCRKKAAEFMLRQDLMMFAFSRDNPQHFIGATGLHRFNWETRQFEIGYWVRSDKTGKGYATEICTALCHYAFEALDASRVEIFHADGNDASARVIEKVGFEKEGILRQCDELPSGEIVDKHAYGMLSPENIPALDVTW